MDFRFYFLKEGTRIFDIADLIACFQANPNVLVEKRNEDRYFLYHHPLLKFDARFVLASRSVVPNLERLNAKYFDINFYVEFPVTLPDFFVELIIDIIEDVSKTFHFHIYNEALNDVIPYNRNILLKTFQAWKKAYKESNEEEIADYKRMDEQSLAQVYTYILRKNSLELMYDKTKYQISKYSFLASEKSRTAFVSIEWNGIQPLIIPPVVDILYYDDGKSRKYIPYVELLTKINKLLKPIDGFGVIQMIEMKNISKVKKIITKSKFSPLTTVLKEISLEKILDI